MLTTRDRSDPTARNAGDVDTTAGQSRSGSIAQGPIAHLALRLDPARLRRFHRELAARLAAELGGGVTWIAGQGGPAAPGSIDLLFALERLVYRLRGARLSDRLALDDLALADTSAEPPDLIVDLCGEAAANNRPTLRLLFD